jgi:hypothetical protein
MQSDVILNDQTKETTLVDEQDRDEPIISISFCHWPFGISTHSTVVSHHFLAKFHSIHWQQSFVSFRSGKVNQVH